MFENPAWTDLHWSCMFTGKEELVRNHFTTAIFLTVCFYVHLRLQMKHFI